VSFAAHSSAFSTQPMTPSAFHVAPTARERSPEFRCEGLRAPGRECCWSRAGYAAFATAGPPHSTRRASECASRGTRARVAENLKRVLEYTAPRDTHRRDEHAKRTAGCPSRGG
jgi:hypothetical protein